MPGIAAACAYEEGDFYSEESAEFPADTGNVVGAVGIGAGAAATAGLNRKLPRVIPMEFGLVGP